jgi:glycosyltransferase involved in cell wall biosynthesis
MSLGRPALIRLTAVMPCLNEERTVGTCIEKVFSAFHAMHLAGEVVIADNGSSDRSPAIAAALGARVVHVETKGYGAALMAGIKAARGEYIILADSDDSYDWLTIEPFVQKLDEGYDVVVGNRFTGGIEAGAMPMLHRYLGNPVLSWLARTMHRAPIGDFHCGMRAFRRDAFPKMNCHASGMEFATEMIVNASRLRLRIAEVPTRLQRDGRDRPPHLRSFRDGWRHLRFIFTYAPNYLYLLPGGLLFALGAALVAALASGPTTLFGQHLGIHFLALGSALTLVGFNVINLGILAKVIVAREHPDMPAKITDRAIQSFTLEAGLVVGVLLLTAGVAIDGALLWHWLGSRDEPMESSVHLCFVATLMIVIGVNAVFNSFLLAMLVGDRRERR